MPSDSDSLVPDAITDLSPSQREMVENSCIQNQAVIKSFLRGILRREELVEEAFQRTVLKAIQAVDSVALKNVRGWLFRIALNEARQILRQSRRQEVWAGEVRESAAMYNREQRPAEQGLLNSEAADTVRKAIQDLSPEAQEVLFKRLFEEKSFADIAAELNAPLGSVLTWMRRGLMKLREDSRIRELL